MESKRLCTLPWFSSEEWLAVYEDAFKDNPHKAYDQMCVWKSRYGKLPVAIEATFPLLRGILAQQDVHLHDSFKQSLITSSISRFVSILHRAYNVELNEKSRILYGMDNTINLPPFLNKIRNLLVHAHEIMGAKLTLTTALEAAMQWIKFYYWDDEARKLQQICVDKNKEKPQKNVKSVTEEPKPSPLEMTQWEDCAIAYRTQILKHKIKRKKDVSHKARTLFLRTLRSMNKTYPEYCTRTFFQIFFCSAEMSCNPSQLNDFKKCRMCDHNFTLDMKFVKYTSYAMKYFDMKIFIKEIIRNAQSHPKICSDWFQMLANTVDPNTSCPKHLFQLKASSLKRDIDWKATIFQLLSLCDHWSLIIGLRILNIKWVSVKPKVKTMIMHLVKIYLQGLSQNSSILESTGEIPITLSQEGGTLQDLVKATVIHSPQIHLHKLNAAYQKVNTDVEIKTQFSQFGHTHCLGILPHQVGDPSFFKKLLLHSKNTAETS